MADEPASAILGRMHSQADPSDLRYQLMPNIEAVFERFWKNLLELIKPSQSVNLPGNGEWQHRREKQIPHRKITTKSCNYTSHMWQS
ncbi:Hypothetical predicted protein [Pelobates cultripes]|uniref:Uncharacterized protein n=1 Tax=Pelobates cultripes TaxID=61616 RepID=A0AAD1R363_PELCU|nr:Hypothetical predicted protein [Pelobates cultripes]